MDKYIFNLFAPCLMLTKYVAFTTSPIDRLKFSHSFRDKIQEKNSKISLGVAERLRNYEHDCEPHDWTILMKPHILLKSIQRYHLIGPPFLLSMVTQIVLMTYMLIKCLFHILRTGTNNELASYYDRTYFFPRLFESHERPDLFYGHTLVIVLYMICVRLIASYRLVKMSVVNETRYNRVSISQLNYSYLTYIYMPLRDWLRLMRATVNHRAHFKHDPQKMTDHLHLDPGVIKRVSELRYHDVIYYVNRIDFERCYRTECPSLYQVEKGPGGRLRNASRFKRWHTTWPIHRMDTSELGLLAVGHLVLLSCMVFGFVVVFLCSLYFELEGAIREKHGAVLSIVGTLKYLPEWLEEPRRLIRLCDLVLLAFIQLPNQFDAMVYYTDCLALISRTYKVMLNLEQDRLACSTYLGATSADNPAGLVLDAGREFESRQREEASLNRRLIERIKLSQVLKAEFQDLKQTHTLYLNTMTFFSGLSISYCISLIILSTSFSTRVAISLNAFVEFAPMTACMIMSAVLNNMVRAPV